MMWKRSLHLSWPGPVLIFRLPAAYLPQQRISHHIHILPPLLYCDCPVKYLNLSGCLHDNLLVIICVGDNNRCGDIISSLLNILYGESNKGLTGMYTIALTDMSS